MLGVAGYFASREKARDAGKGGGNVDTAKTVSGRHRLRTGHAKAASLSLAAVLLILSAAALLGAMFSYRAGVATTQATMVSNDFEQARYFVGAEESLERKYRLEPGPEIRRRHWQAGTAMLAALHDVAALRADAALIEDVTAKHRRASRFDQDQGFVRLFSP